MADTGQRGFRVEIYGRPVAAVHHAVERLAEAVCEISQFALQKYQKRCAPCKIDSRQNNAAHDGHRIAGFQIEKDKQQGGRKNSAAYHCQQELTYREVVKLHFFDQAFLCSDCVQQYCRRSIDTPCRMRS